MAALTPTTNKATAATTAKIIGNIGARAVQMAAPNCAAPIVAASSADPTTPKLTAKPTNDVFIVVNPVIINGIAVPNAIIV